MVSGSCIRSHQTFRAYPDLTLCPPRPSLLLRGGSCVGTEARTHHLPWLGHLGVCRHVPCFLFLRSQRNLVFPVGLFPLDFVPGLSLPEALSPASLTRARCGWMVCASLMGLHAAVLWGKHGDNCADRACILGHTRATEQHRHAHCPCVLTWGSI